VSRTECTQALLRAGFRPVGPSKVPVIFTQAGRAIVVPDVPLLDGETLGIILRTAGLTATWFLECLNADNHLVARA
jgi:hypothetical protein